MFVSISSSVLHAGHVSGSSSGVELLGFESTIAISGITPFARWILTWEPTRTSFSATQLKLFMVMFEMRVPSTSTGCTLAHGVSLPVLPTVTVIPVTMVSAVSPGYL